MEKVELDGTTYTVPLARTWVTYTIHTSKEIKDMINQANVDLKKAEEALKKAEEEAAQAKKKSEEDQEAAKKALEEAKAAKKEAEEAKLQAEKATFKLKKVTVKSVKSKKKKTASVTWKSIKDVKGYTIQYSKKSNFKSAKTVNVQGASKKTATIKKLSAKKKYYVRVRAYKLIGGKKVYTSWSTKKSVKVK